MRHLLSTATVLRGATSDMPRTLDLLKKHARELKTNFRDHPSPYVVAFHSTCLIKAAEYYNGSLGRHSHGLESRKPFEDSSWTIAQRPFDFITGIL